jgi:hypothetical protein
MFLSRILRRNGRGQDIPFAGTLVPNCAYGIDRRVQSVMVELRRDLYMDEQLCVPKPRDFARMQQCLAELRTALTQFVLSRKEWPTTPMNPERTERCARL